ncbi:CAS1 domain-containing protein 1-like [Mizuhopecten yessoensis]|uniref:CAS1 domain-containing protein 1 n=1 Tax=Mizuhopecten yessoensis TaxID=6573 RepID=A0A210Q103_MIZYE|nr:CAS1 domain-containing protein 1-like [Mizuhopecten yessoensis]OWF42418.1 CAS1 domain-containing protein 1 [Mizuhopecten yessoensis]
MADNRSSSTTPEITYYLNIENAKILAFTMVMGFVMYHSVIHMKYGNDSCKWLLSDGRFPGYNTWQPYGCMMHKYNNLDARMCMHYISYWGGHNHITFLGDSRIRQLYFEFINLLSPTPVKSYKTHSDLHFRDNKIHATVDFLWHPMVNISMYVVYKNWMMQDMKDRPNLVITGSGTWCIKQFNGSEDAKNNFAVNLTMVIPLMKKMKQAGEGKTNIIWMLQDPVDESKLYGNRSSITNQQIDMYNRVALDHLDDESVAKVWSSSRLVAQGIRDRSEDGLHMTKPALDLDAQMLMNMYCNDNMNHVDGTCCRSPEVATTLQIIVASFFLVCMVSAFALMVYRKRLRRISVKARAENGQRNGQNSSAIEPFQPCFDVLTSLAKFGLIMAYFYICDRTNFFMKENKYYTHVNFILPFAYIMILGFFFTESTDQTVVLHRDQTDEWKGWMQLVILIYHLTGASKVLPIYMHIRVLVSSYLFLTGYGHFMFFWKKGQYSILRYCQVLFRLNFLVVSLCFVMNRPYQFYYFIPLVSFWFIIVYLTMAIFPQVTASSADARSVHYLYLILKFIILATVITLFYFSEVFFEKVFLTQPLKALFVTSDDSIHEWRFRWKLDRYSVLFGMLFAFTYQMLIKFRIINDTTTESLVSKGFSYCLVVLGFIGLGSFAAFAFLCKNKRECNDYHSYIVFIPIVSYITVRNVPGWLRTKYSSFFAWFGKISLELFIAQYHIWLAADTNGVLALIPSYPVLNVIITSFIFICVSHEISKVTNTLAKYFVPNEWKPLLRNLIIFALILLPVAITHGVLKF